MNNTDENVIEIKNLTKEYKMFARKKDRLLETIIPTCKRHGVFKAMDDLNLEVKSGEVLGILGKNGAGKSTLLKMITGVVTPTSGSVKVNGKISSLLELGTAFNMELTGLENIYQHGQVMGLTNEQIEEKKQEIIDFADIGDHLYQPVKTYSSGMFARLAFACAINVDPDILIVDEVLSVGDMAFQLKCFKKFEEFKKKGKTILFVTHAIGEVLKNCTRTIIISSGKKIFDGDVKDGVEMYKKMIVGISPSDSNKVFDEKDESLKRVKNYSINKLLKAKDCWMKNFTVNPNMIDYGNGDAHVIDFGIFDENNNFKTVINNNEEITLKSKIAFDKDIKDPIFTMTVKDFKGNDICGTNTLLNNILTGEFKKGDVVIAEFKQVLPLAPGKYTLSFSCTKFNSRGELEVLNRKYDALLIEILSDKSCVGMVQINSKTKVEKI